MSRQSLARIAALFYVLNFVLGGLALSWMAKGPTPASDAITIAAAADYAIVSWCCSDSSFEPARRVLSWAVAAAGLTAAPYRWLAAPPHRFAGQPVRGVRRLLRRPGRADPPLVADAALDRRAADARRLELADLCLARVRTQLAPWNMVPGRSRPS